MGFDQNGKDQLSRQINKCGSSPETKGNWNILNTAQQCKLRWIGHILKHESLLHAITEGRILGKATTGHRKKIVTNAKRKSDIISKTYEDLKMEAAEDRSS